MKIHTNMPRNCTVFLKLRVNFYSIKWTTVFVRDVKGKPCNFNILVWIIIILPLKHLSIPWHSLDKIGRC